MSSLLQKTSRRGFYDPWEAMPLERRLIIQRENLDSYVGFASSSLAFYRERLQNYQSGSEYPLKHVPVLTSDELRELLPPRSKALVTGGITDYTVFQSGGTTGFPKSSLFSHAELERLTDANGRGFFAVGLRETDRVANLFASGSLYMTFIHINRMLQQYGCMNFPFSNHTPAEFVHTVVKLFNINCFTGISSLLLSLLRTMAEMGLEGIQIDKIYYGGEHLYEADKREIESKYGTKVIRAPGYGTVDTWYIGYQCMETPTGVFHAHDDDIYMEIVDEDTQEHCGPEEVGMVYVTAFPRRVTPIIRYRVGDRALWIKDRCPCGRTTPLFKLLGRGDDVLRIGYDSVDYNSLQEVVLKVPGLSGTVQMEKRRKQSKDELIIRVETALPKEKHAEATEKLIESLFALRPVLKTFIDRQTICPLQIELLGEGTLARNPRTGKLIRVLDKAGEE